MNARLTLLIVCLLNVYLQLCGQGLKIQGNDYFIDNRSSYIVFDDAPPVFKDRLELGFEIAPMNIREAYSIGYILRIKNEEANTTYNILYNNQGGRTEFKLNHEGRDVLIVASLDKEKLYENQWIEMHLAFDLLKDSVVFRINEEEFRAGGLRLEKQWRPYIHFGRSEHVIDVPTFCLRNLTVSDMEKVYSFPLNENEGTDVHDSRKKVMGHVQNPVWLINDAYYWKPADVTFASGTVAGSNINADTQEIYYFNKDSILFYNVRTQDTHSHKYINDCPLHLRLGTNFIDRRNKRLYVYEVFDLLGGDVTMAYLDLETFGWTAVSKQLLPIQLHHHSSYFDEANRRYIIFGGFGNLKYNKNFYSFNLDTHTWETLEFGGDPITPRYFTSLGCSEDANVLYLFGGMGNESGDQSVGRVYYYELYKVDLKEKQITRLWEIPWKKENVVPVRGMVSADDESVYTLCYPEHFSKSFLKLYRFSVKDGCYEVLGDSIPIVSEKITTNANLYYNKRTNELYTIVQEFDYDDTASTAKVYSLSYPPVTMEGLSFYTDKEKKTGLWILLVALAISVPAAVWGYIRKRKPDEEKAPDETTQPEPEDTALPTPPAEQMEQIEQANALYMFGYFSIRDRNNKDITYMLSSKLKQAFFLILQYSSKNGITTQELSELLWPDKPEDKVKNSRGVTLNNLRKILGELDGIKLVHEKGSYKIVFTPECHCDYLRCLDIIEANTADQIDEFVTIISRGKFLRSEDIPLLDSFKEHIERKLEPILIVEMEKWFAAGNYLFTIAFCEAIFHIDPLNEEALYYIVNSLVKQNMKDEAKRKYLSFVAEYKTVLNAEYPKSFKELKA
ncbi:DNA-binding transcriptional activator [Bacteroides sp. OttesenSCG-928-J23]|nr:DNA-binding transcriptional activator [Bacteroides sp. OttesenSCG-928-N06]MDL2247174.1 DNA-binding transcriptional activator [Bacteroides sp. OttesenSCG-928-J23]MDL2303906.1 DNA-binding transcriptional activator [Bacteroides sp. OttesenSCG-928-D19]